VRHGKKSVLGRTSNAGIVLEALLVMALAAGFGFVVNQVSPRGLRLTRDYFPSVTNSAPPAAKVSPPPDSPPATSSENSEASDIERRIKSKGLQPIGRGPTERLFHDPRYEQGLVVFIDARDEEHYVQGHIPGAYPLDRYHPEKDLAADLPPCENAEQVVVYCTGGECEDAEFTALLLRDAGVSNQKIFVYGGGFEDWSGSHLPLEEGARGSGQAPARSP
jgi:rhodanese-related sulfurtransferase